MLQSKVLGFVSWGREVCRFRQSVVARSMQDCKTRGRVHFRQIRGLRAVSFGVLLELTMHAICPRPNREALQIQNTLP